MTTGLLKILILKTILTFFSNFTFALSGKEISTQVSNWLSSKGVLGQPIFSGNRIYKDCDQKLQISKYLNSFKTVKVNCPNNDALDLFIRIKLDKEIKTNSRLKSKKIEDKNQFKNKIKIYKKENKFKKNTKFSK